MTPREGQEGKRVQYGRFGEDVSSMRTFPIDATVNDILASFEVEVEKGETFGIDGQVVEGTHVPTDGQCIYIAKTGSGN